MGISKKVPTMRRIFFRYLLTMIIAFIVFLAIYFELSLLLIKLNVFLPANYSEGLAKTSKSQIQSAQSVTESMIPKGCKFVVFDKNYKVIKTDLNSEDLEKAKKCALGESYGYRGGTKQYYVIPRKDGVCVLQYYIIMRYSPNFLNNSLPNPQVMFALIFIFLCVTIIFVVSTLYAKKIKKQLNPLLEVVEKIKEKDLDFEAGYSKIKEFNDVLLSLSDMKEELKKSLSEKWSIEQAKREQISALAHDIKTPLAVIKGNTELLIDSPLNEDQQEYTNFIHKNANQIEKYIKLLIELSKAEQGFNIQLEKVNTREFVNNIYSQLNALACIKKLQVEFEEKSLPEEINIDHNLMYRAIMNVISNAVDYSKDNSKIYFKVEYLQDNICFKIIDSGKGFSEKDIKFAITQFYTGDGSRTSKTHYGMGLYIANSIVKQHGGELHIENSPITGGAQVVIKVPVNFS
ncbi:HAMP domain-containing histidine kinase [Clostridium sp. P21]|uniref:histidine kinase n=1 Tax=Clostridium muellerianum TaxID=2716538 RepID=A0A7Y0EG14_9CLOT|nr:HAMP domain-containing sensor histidine kinase [Clostridium muellerianum]NMM62814.1 HAMP domain-containing histidine kinase [Clostridium muellerianum]